MSRYNHNLAARSDNLKSPGDPEIANRAAWSARRRALLLGTALAGTVALTPFAAQAASDLWTGGSSNAWGTALNWNTGVVPTTTSAVTIGVTTNNPVQITTPVLLNATSGTNIGSLTVYKAPDPIADAHETDAARPKPLHQERDEGDQKELRHAGPGEHIADLLGVMAPRLAEILRQNINRAEQREAEDAGAEIDRSAGGGRGRALSRTPPISLPRQ
jgi:hypothetical protein